MNGYVFLAAAIVFEVAGTTFLKLSDGFSRLWPSLGVVVCYGLTFWLFSNALKTIDVGVGYAIWAGVGIVLLALLGVFFLGEKLDLAGVLGMGLIIAGVVVLNVFSNTGSH